MRRSSGLFRAVFQAPQGFPLISEHGAGSNALTSASEQLMTVSAQVSTRGFLASTSAAENPTTSRSASTSDQPTRGFAAQGRPSQGLQPIRGEITMDQRVRDPPGTSHVRKLTSHPRSLHSSLFSFLTHTNSCTHSHTDVSVPPDAGRAAKEPGDPRIAVERRFPAKTRGKFRQRSRVQTSRFHYVI